MILSADGEDRNAIRRPAPKFIKGHVGGLALHVPQGAVEAGDGANFGPAVAIGCVRQRPHVAPERLDVRRVLADQARRQVLADDLQGCGVNGAGSLAVDRLSHRPILGMNARDDGAFLGHRVDAAAEIARQLDANMDRFDAGDLVQGASPADWIYRAKTTTEPRGDETICRARGAPSACAWSPVPRRRWDARPWSRRNRPCARPS